MATRPLVPTGTPAAVDLRKAPLCVDLDGSLVKTDTLLEGLVQMLRRHPLALLLLPLWLLRGRAYVKRQVAGRGPVDAALLPYREEVLDLLRREHSAGRRLVLATGADSSLAEAVATHVGLFSEVVASDGILNLTGRSKRDALQHRYRETGFAYLGNSSHDLVIWRDCREAFVVGAPHSVLRRLRHIAAPVTVLEGHDSTLRAFLKALRLHQWVKNALVFLPLACSHRLLEPGRLGQALLAFVSFSLCASAIYNLNDLADLEADRRHPRKRSRPYAAGTLPLTAAAAVVPLFLAVAFAIGWTLSVQFTALLVAYTMASLLYSLKLKSVPVLDVLLLAGFYTLRLMAGGAATGTYLSHWLLGFSLFLFFSLALIKRTSELRLMGTENGLAARRGYLAGDAELLTICGVSSGLIAVLVFALYITSPDVQTLYRVPALLWGICPLLLYWVVRVWLLASRGRVHEDPVLFAIRDKASYAVGTIALLLVVFASR
jgi:4-hydroxybenzoate polyprenyltransferase